MARYRDLDKIDPFRCGFYVSVMRAKFLEWLPEEDVAPVVHAHWISHDDDGVYHECSNCGVHDYWNTSNIYIMFDYCPDCGAIMDEGVEE